LKNAEGELRHLEGIVTLACDSHGEYVGVRGVVRDVSERRQAEIALERQNAEYRLLFDSNPCPMYVCEAKTLAFVAVNQAAIDHYGYSREEFLEMTTLEMRTTADVP